MTGSTTATTVPFFGQGLEKFFAGLGAGMIAYMERQSCFAEIRRLNAMSDTELARMGIARDEIVRHVFRDILYI